MIEESRLNELINIKSEYDDYDVDLSNYEWCSVANSYMDNEYCKNTGCEKCRFYLDS